MALVTKDFQTQTQWALVAIPAPIYFVFGLFCGLCRAQSKHVERSRDR